MDLDIDVLNSIKNIDVSKVSADMQHKIDPNDEVESSIGKLDSNVLIAAKNANASQEARKQYLSETYAADLVNPLSGVRDIARERVQKEITDPYEQQMLLEEVQRLAKMRDTSYQQAYATSDYGEQFGENVKRVIGRPILDSVAGMKRAAKGIYAGMRGEKTIQDDPFLQQLEAAQSGRVETTPQNVLESASAGAVGFVPDILASNLMGGPVGVAAYWTAKTFPDRRRDYQAAGLSERDATLAGAASSGAEAALWMLDRDPTGLTTKLSGPLHKFLQASAKDVMQRVPEPLRKQVEGRFVQAGLEIAEHALIGGARSTAQTAIAEGGQKVASGLTGTPTEKTWSGIGKQALVSGAEAIPMMGMMAASGAASKATTAVPVEQIRSAIFASEKSGSAISRRDWKRYGLPEEDGHSEASRRRGAKQLAEELRLDDQLRHFTGKKAYTPDEWKDQGLPEDEGKTFTAQQSYLRQKFLLPEKGETTIRADDTLKQYGVTTGEVGDIKLQAGQLKVPEKLESVVVDKDHDIRGVPIGTIGDKQVFLVNGTKVNNQCIKDPSKRDFTQGGHNKVYDFIPKDQIWIDATAINDPGEMTKWATHESVENRLMEKGGLPYEKDASHKQGAHEIANMVEFGWAEDSPKQDVSKSFNKVESPVEAPITESVIAKGLSKVRYPEEIRRRFSKVSDAYKDAIGMLAPSVRDEGTREAALTLRKWNAQAAAWDERNFSILEETRSAFNSISPVDRKEFIMRNEEGKNQLLPFLDPIADIMRKEIDAASERVEGTGRVKEFYDNYWRHLYKHSPDIDVTLGKVIRKSFNPAGMTRKRKYPTLREALAEGMELVTDNPLEYSLLMLHQMNKFVARTHAVKELKDRGLLKFIPESLKESYLPAGYKMIDDPGFVVKAETGYTITNYRDKLLYDHLSLIAGSLGIKSITTSLDLPKDVLGFITIEENAKILMHPGAPLSTLAHEISHHIGAVFDLYDYIQSGDHKGIGVTSSRPEIAQELSRLASLRHEGMNPTEEHREYVQSKPEREAVLLEAWLQSPEKMEFAAPNVTKIWKDFLGKHEELSSLLHLDRSLVMEPVETQVEQSGVRVIGRWAAPTGVTKLFENELSPGFRCNENSFIKGAYNFLRLSGNSMNMANLSISAFHGVFATLDTVSSKMSNGLSKLNHGEVTEGLKDILTAYNAPMTLAKLGNQIREEIRSGALGGYNSELRQMCEAVIESGGRLSMDARYRLNASKALRESWYQLKNNTDFTEKVKEGIKLPFEILGTALEATTYPILEAYVPRLKLGTFGMMASGIYRRAVKEGWNEDQIRDRLARSWDSVENRLGQLCYDNLFWNQYVKDTAMLLVRSVGWNLGTFREIGGAAIDAFRSAATLSHIKTGSPDRDLFTDKMSYTMAMVATGSIVGSVMNWLLTGEPPKNLKDVFYPRTGEANPDGSEARLSIPFYTKDLFAYAIQPGKTLLHKLHPMWSTTADMLKNEDFYGNKIMNEDDPWIRQLSDAASFLGKSFSPYSAQNFIKMRESDEGLTQSFLQSGFGFTSAPRYITQSNAMQKAQKYAQENLPSGSKTREQAEQQDVNRKLVKKMRKGDDIAISEAVNAVGFQKAKGLYKKSTQSALQIMASHLSVPQLKKVWDIASDSEKSELRDLAIRKRRQSKTEDEIKSLDEIIDKSQK